MARFVSMIVAASILMGYTNIAEAWYEKAADAIIHVGGKVLCQDCTQGWNEWVEGGKPIQGSKVSITCMDDRSRVMYYGSDETDEAGKFDMMINKFINGKELKVKGCSVRLVSSPDETCNILTNFGGGQSGVKLSRPTSVYRDLVQYTLDPFYFTSPMCDEPDTHEVDSTQGNY